MSKVFMTAMMAVASTTLFWGSNATADVRYRGYLALKEYSLSDGAVPPPSTPVNLFFRARNRRLEARVGSTPWFKMRTTSNGKSVTGVSRVFAGSNGCDYQNSLASDIPTKSKILVCLKATGVCPSSYGYFVYCGNLRAR